MKKERKKGKKEKQNKREETKRVTAVVTRSRHVYV